MKQVPMHSDAQLNGSMSSSGGGDASKYSGMESKDAAVTIDIPLSDYQHFRLRRQDSSNSPVRLRSLNCLAARHSILQTASCAQLMNKMHWSKQVTRASRAPTALEGASDLGDGEFM